MMLSGTVNELILLLFHRLCGPLATANADVLMVQYRAVAHTSSSRMRIIGGIASFRKLGVGGEVEVSLVRSYSCVACNDATCVGASALLYKDWKYAMKSKSGSKPKSESLEATAWMMVAGAADVSAMALVRLVLAVQLHQR